MLALRFRTIASQLQILGFNAPDLNGDYLLSVAKKFLSKRVSWAENRRRDLTDIFELWEVLNIDSVIVLENAEGKLIRVGISFVGDERRGSELVYSRQSKTWKNIRHALNLEQYWVFVVKAKNFPTPEEWTDILYDEIDVPTSKSGCRLVTL